MRKSLLDLKLSWVALIFVTPELENALRPRQALCKDEEKVERPASDMQQQRRRFPRVETLGNSRNGPKEMDAAL